MVPSSGSITQRRPLVPARALPSSPTMPSSGRAASSAVDDQPLGRPVHLGHHVGGRRLGLDASRRPRAPAPSSSRSRPARCGDASAGAGRRSAAGVGTSRRIRHERRYRAPVPVARPRPPDRPAPGGRPAQRHRHPPDAPPCAGPWPRPRSATTASATTPPSTASRSRYAERAGKEAALFVPSGTMANQVALRVLAGPGTSVVAGRRQHVVTHEGGAFGVNQVAQLHLLDDDDGTLDPADDRPPGRRPPPTAGRRPSLVCVENTHLAAGGRPVAARPAGRGGRRRACRSTSTAPGCSTPRWPPAPPSAERSAAATTVTALPVEGPRRAGRLAAGRPGRRHRPGPASSASGWAAACARSASSPPPGSSRSTRWSTAWPTTTRRARAPGRGGGRPLARRRLRPRRRPHQRGAVPPRRPVGPAGRAGRPGRAAR